jgi:predicted nucleotidyltransferase
MINHQERQVLSDLVDVVNTLDLPMILIGAGARLIMFDRQFGEGRGTKDWDVAISIDSWEVYQKLRETLIDGDSPRFKATKQAHKFIHIETDIEIDIVPFGAIGEPDQQIYWSDSGNFMSVFGFAEALMSSKTTTIDDLEIKIIDLPAFVVLKIFAWSDRGDRTKKDLEDIDFILSKYEDDSRVFDELAEELANEVINFLDGNIYLLGRDIYKMLEKKTLYELNIQLNKLIDSLGDEPQSLGYKLNILSRGINNSSTSAR